MPPRGSQATVNSLGQHRNRSRPIPKLCERSLTAQRLSTRRVACSNLGRTGNWCTQAHGGAIPERRARLSTAIDTNATQPDPIRALRCGRWHGKLSSARGFRPPNGASDKLRTPYNQCTNTENMTCSRFKIQSTLRNNNSTIKKARLRFFVFLNKKETTQVACFNSHKKGKEPHPAFLHCGIVEAFHNSKISRNKSSSIPLQDD